MRTPNTVSTAAEPAETPNFTDLRQRYSDSLQKLSRSELHAKIREMQWPYQLYYLENFLLSVIAAAAGLLLDQPALIIGSMIIAPQVSSALAAPTGVLLADWDLLVESVKKQGLGLGMGRHRRRDFRRVCSLGRGSSRWGSAVMHVELIGRSSCTDRPPDVSAR